MRCLKQAACEKSCFHMRFLKQTASANIIYTGGQLKKTASDNNISTSSVLRSPPVKNSCFHMRFLKQTASANDAVGTYMWLNGFAAPDVLVYPSRSSRRCRSSRRRPSPSLSLLDPPSLRRPSRSEVGGGLGCRLRTPRARHQRHGSRSTA
jgi:hypothetical protein